MNHEHWLNDTKDRGEINRKLTYAPGKTRGFVRWFCPECGRLFDLPVTPKNK